ncbi:MAG: hypothetical protein M3T96_02405 [Acidobacteriota bacterium]|nr:hypothetical protein [Acidobacteriota bacterium]
MNDYQLQTELSDETRRAMLLYSEKSALETEIQNHRKRVSKSLMKSGKVLGFLILFEILFSSLLQRPTDFFVVIVYGLGYIAEIVWLFFGLRKRQSKLEEWENAAENQFRY